MSVAFKVPIWFFLQTGGICEKTKNKVTIITIMVNMEDHYECYIQETESWVLNAVPETREVFSRWVHCPGTSTLSLTKTHAGPTHTNQCGSINNMFSNRLIIPYAILAITSEVNWYTVVKRYQPLQKKILDSFQKPHPSGQIKRARRFPWWAGGSVASWHYGG